MATRRALIVGAGGMGRAWGRNLKEHPEVEVAGWVDIRPGAAADANAELGFEGAYVGTDLADALKATLPDFVVDVTVPEAHRDVTVQALDAGVPVIGEKPMASSMAEARAMVEASDRSGKLYMVSQSRRYDDRILAFRDLIAKNIGPLGILNADFYIGAHFGGFRDAMDSPLILDMAIHSFDQARLISGARPVSVYAEEFNPKWSWYRGDACATALFTMENDLRFTYRGSWCAEGMNTSWECEWRALGALGAALWDGHSRIEADVVEETGGFHSKCRRVTGEVGSSPGGIAGSLREFLNALDTGATPQGECHDNILSLAMVFGVITSAREGRRVEIDEVLNG